MKTAKPLYYFITGSINPIKNFFILLWFFVREPALWFHELCHVFMFGVAWFYSGASKLRVASFEWCKVYSIKDEENDSLQIGSHLHLSFDAPDDRYGNFWSCVVSIAPLVGFIILLTYSIVSGHYALTGYCIMGFKVFFLSQQDIDTLREKRMNPRVVSILQSTAILIKK